MCISELRIQETCGALPHFVTGTATFAGYLSGGAQNGRSNHEG
jgi:hypothetical protein